jgi:hypothetical protein
MILYGEKDIMPLGGRSSVNSVVSATFGPLQSGNIGAKYLIPQLIPLSWKFFLSAGQGLVRRLNSLFSATCAVKACFFR